MILSGQKNLLKKISELLEVSRRVVVAQVNHVMIQTYRTIGKEIVEFEQGGNKKAKYGTGLLTLLSKGLTVKFGEGFGVTNLHAMRKFFLTYPKFQTLSEKFRNLTWSHYVFLMQIDDEAKRNFYAIESNTNSRSLRELRRQFDASLYHRLALSRNKKEVKKLSSKGQIIKTPLDALKDPYILDFLGLDEKVSYSENDLEQAIINNIQKFLIELGKGFMFVERQKRISNDEEHYRIDLVFYHRFLKCFVLIDLKKGKLTHQDIGQMQMYVNYYDQKIKASDENPTIGLLLCEQNNQFVVKYTIGEKNSRIFAKQYKLYLPTQKELEKKLVKILK